MRHVPFVLLAVLGMLPATLLPVVTATARELRFTIGEAGTLSGFIIFSAALGALAIARVGVPGRWKTMVLVGLAVLVALEIASASVSSFLPLLCLQMLCGAIGGMLTGIGYAAIGRAASPDRLFASLVTLQFLVGGIGVLTLPTLVRAMGAWLLFAMLAAAALLVLLIVSLVADALLPLRPAPRTGLGVPSGDIRLGFAALFFTQAAHTAGGVFILDFGRSLGLAPAHVQLAAGLGGGIGVVGAIAATLLGIRFGRRWPVILASVVGMGAALLLFQPTPIAWLLGCTLGSIAWAYSVPYILGACVDVEPTRDDAMWLSFVAKLGLATGPFAATLVVSDGRYGGAIILASVLLLVGLVLFLRLEARARAGMP